MGRYVTTSDMSAMPTEKYPGVLAFVLLYSLSPSQFCILKTTAALCSQTCQYLLSRLLQARASEGIDCDAPAPRNWCAGLHRTAGPRARARARAEGCSYHPM